MAQPDGGHRRLGRELQHLDRVRIQHAAANALRDIEHHIGLVGVGIAQDAQVRGVLSEAEIDTALDPAGYLGSAGAFVDRALELYRAEESP